MTHFGALTKFFKKRNNLKEEYIIASAIHVDDGVEYSHQRSYKIETGYVLCGYRHHHIINTTRTKGFADLGQPCRATDLLNRKSQVQGFITSKGRFVNREEAYIIANRAEQFIATPISHKTLYSEDIF